MHIYKAIHPCVPGCCQDGKVAATSSKGINWQVILRALFPLRMHLLVFSSLFSTNKEKYCKMRSLRIQKKKGRIKEFCKWKAWEEKNLRIKREGRRKQNWQVTFLGCFNSSVIQINSCVCVGTAFALTSPRSEITRNATGIQGWEAKDFPFLVLQMGHALTSSESLICLLPPVLPRLQLLTCFYGFGNTLGPNRYRELQRTRFRLMASTIKRNQFFPALGCGCMSS